VELWLDERRESDTLPTDADPALEAEEAVDEARSSARAGALAPHRAASNRACTEGRFMREDSEEGATAQPMPLGQP
jgi:hypothetical protein